MQDIITLHRKTNQFPAESFTRWDVLWNRQTNVNPDEKKSPKPHDGKSLITRQKFDNVAKIDKATKGE